MVGVIVSEQATKAMLFGHGIRLTKAFEIAPGIQLRPEPPKIDLEEAATASGDFRDYVAAISANELATFCIEVEGKPELLAIKAWNALWLFHLLSLACGTPCFSLLATTDGKDRKFKSANRNFLIEALPSIVTASPDQLTWGKEHLTSFNALIREHTFATSMRCLGNAYYLPDTNTRIMLLWAGIEGLFSVDGELNRRLALYATLMRKGTPAEKVTYFKEIKKAYGLRSKAVHGSNLSQEKLQAGYEVANEILTSLLARCVELGRVPSTEELDALAASQSVQ